jgi:glycosyltransferase involved in cell wall biosynthesis
VNEQDHPKVSCLLPVYNGEQFIEEAVRSLLAQTLKNFELVVVDDGSTDSTPRKLAALNAEDQRLRILRQANGGIVAALNAGLGLCRAGYIARMDADDVAAPDRFEFQADYLDRHPGCVLVGGVARSNLPLQAVARTTGGRHRQIRQRLGETLAALGAISTDGASAGSSGRCRASWA